MSIDKQRSEIVEQIKLQLTDKQANHNDVFVLDIDETIITCANVKHLFKTKNDIFRWQHKGNFAGVQQIVELYHWLKQHGYQIAFITGRKQSVEKPTLANLQRVVGESLNTDFIFFKPKSSKDTQAYKIEARRWLYNNGYRVVGNLGDQPTDLEGGYADHTWLLPSTY